MLAGSWTAAVAAEAPGGLSVTQWNGRARLQALPLRALSQLFAIPGQWSLQGTPVQLPSVSGGGCAAGRVG